MLIVAIDPGTNYTGVVIFNVHDNFNLSLVLWKFHNLKLSIVLTCKLDNTCFINGVYTKYGVPSAFFVWLFNKPQSILDGEFSKFDVDEYEHDENDEQNADGKNARNGNDGQKAIIIILFYRTIKVFHCYYNCNKTFSTMKSPVYLFHQILE